MDTDDTITIPKSALFELLLSTFLLNHINRGAIAKLRELAPADAASLMAQATPQLNLTTKAVTSLNQSGALRSEFSKWVDAQHPVTKH